MQMPKGEEKKLSPKEIQEAQIKKEAEDLKNAARRLFSTPDGIRVAKHMMKMSGIYDACDVNRSPLDVCMDDKAMRAFAGRQFIYKYFIVGMLTPQQRMKIEEK